MADLVYVATAAWTGHTPMFQLFLRARVDKYLRARQDNQNLEARSVDRDAASDRSRVGSILEAIERALHAAEQEHSDLKQRIEHALARAAVTSGSGTEEQLQREPLDSHHHDPLSTEIANGQYRLKELAAAITHFKFLKAATLSRFPDHKPVVTGG